MLTLTSCVDLDLACVTVEVDEPSEEEDCVDSPEPIYMNVNTSRKLTNPIKVEDLPAFIKKARETGFEVIKAEHGVGRFGPANSLLFLSTVLVRHYHFLMLNCYNE